jgi:hypothetical protein
MTALRRADERQIYWRIKQTLLMKAASSHRFVAESTRSISTIAAPQSEQTQKVVAGSASVAAQPACCTRQQSAAGFKRHCPDVDLVSASRVSKQAEMADAHQSLRQDVREVAPQERLRPTRRTESRYPLTSTPSSGPLRQNPRFDSTQ